MPLCAPANEQFPPACAHLGQGKTFLESRMWAIFKSANNCSKRCCCSAPGQSQGFNNRQQVVSHRQLAKTDGSREDTKFPNVPVDTGMEVSSIWSRKSAP